MLAPRVREHARRILVDELHVRDERDARVEAFEQIVREQRVLGNRVLERRVERVDVVQALAGEDAFAEQVLIGVGHRRRVRIDAGVARVQPREQRSGGARERDADPRLQDAVALGDAARSRIEGRAVQRMRDDADQLPRRIARQARVAVERDAVAHLRQDREIADVTAKLVSVAPRSSRLNSSILPRLRSHPIHKPSRSFHCRCRWNRKKRSERPSPCLRVERLDARARRGQNLGVARQRLGRGVAKIAEHREMNVRVDVAERLDFEVREEIRARARRCRGSSARSPSCAPLAGTRSSSSRGRRRGGIRWLMMRCTIWIAQLAGRHQREQRRQQRAPPAPALREGHTRVAAATSSGGADARSRRDTPAWQRRRRTA